MIKTRIPLVFRSPLAMQWFAFLCIFILLRWSFIVVALSRRRTVLLDQSRSQMQNLARLSAEKVASPLTMADYALKDMRDGWQDYNALEFAAAIHKRQIDLDASAAHHASIADAV